ncbi:MAG TPA: hypothetical protein VF970_14075 [Gemmatimonadales bacterium]
MASEKPSRAVRFVRAQIDPLPNGQCQAQVEIERPGSGLSTGIAQGGSGQADALRAVARAAADALTEAFRTEGAKIRVRGVQVQEAFAQTVVIVSVAATQGTRSQSLLGICDGAADAARATALAVLNGTNRFLGLE